MERYPSMISKGIHPPKYYTNKHLASSTYAGIITTSSEWAVCSLVIMSERLSPTIIMLPPATPTKHTLTLTIIRPHLHEYIHQGRTSSSTHVCSCVCYILNNFILKQSAKFIRGKAGVAKPTLWWTYVIITSLTWIGVNIAYPLRHWHGSGWT